jgi:hypothetical protein
LLQSHEHKPFNPPQSHYTTSLILSLRSVSARYYSWVYRLRW